jgi:hypothetical protein
MLFMKLSGILTKMKADAGAVVQYELRISDRRLPINEIVGKRISVKFTGRCNCVVCGVYNPSPHGQGFCRICFETAPENSPCILHPEQCRGHLGEGRDVQWELDHHVQPHVVYLAQTSQTKVGVTRETQVPVRWIDQGANRALVIARVPNRAMAGEIEVLLKQHFTDKTSWQRMLKNEPADADLALDKQKAIALISSRYGEYAVTDSAAIEFTYPLKESPNQIKSTNLIKEGVFSGILAGIRGQYLILNDGKVLNVRSHSGHHVVFEAG